MASVPHYMQSCGGMNCITNDSHTPTCVYADTIECRHTTSAHSMHSSLTSAVV